MPIKVGIYGYGNLGKGAELALSKAPDMTCVGVFTRRAPQTLKTQTGIPVYDASTILKHKKDIDVLLVCGSSYADLETLTPELAKSFCVVDSFDTHAKIPEHFKRVDQAAKKGKTTAIISVGWDPGLFSLYRLIGESVLPEGESYTFWGRGVSQGHSNALRKVEGVKQAVQYTVPNARFLQRVKEGETPDKTGVQTHARECFIVANEGADVRRIEREIKNMPHYFLGYETTVKFVSEEEFEKNHTGLPHGGSVIRTGFTKSGAHTLESSLKLSSNPEFTGSVLVAYARAVYRMHAEGTIGAKTVFDIPPAYLSPHEKEEFLYKFL